MAAGVMSDLQPVLGFEGTLKRMAGVSLSSLRSMPLLERGFREFPVQLVEVSLGQCIHEYDRGVAIGYPCSTEICLNLEITKRHSASSSIIRSFVEDWRLKRSLPPPEAANQGGLLRRM